MMTKNEKLPKCLPIKKCSINYGRAVHWDSMQPLKRIGYIYLCYQGKLSIVHIGDHFYI